MRIAVVDGQGGGIGKMIVEAIVREMPEEEVAAFGTNAVATSAMLRAGAGEGATGENAIVVNARKADVIVGVIGIIAANSMLGELTPRMAQAIAESPAVKLLIPLNRCNIEVVGVKADSKASLMVDRLVDELKLKLRGAPIGEGPD
jgi:hypothetical protein